MLLEVVSDIDRQDFRPQVAIIASGITSAPDMVEIGGGVARGNLRIEESGIVELLLLKGTGHIGRRHLVGADHVPCEVEAG